MTSHAHVVIDDKAYPIPPHKGIDDVIDEILEAVHDGGRFLSFGTEEGAVEVLVSASTAVRIERVSVAASDRSLPDGAPFEGEDPELWI